MREKLVRETVYLTEAFRWICPKCQAINYNAAVADELTDEGIRDIFCLDMDFEIDEAFRESLGFYKSPVNVKCKGCAERFRAIDSLYANEDNDFYFDDEY